LDPMQQMFAAMFGGPGTAFTGTPYNPASTFNVGEAFGLEGPTAAMANMAVQSIIPNFFGKKGDIFPQFSKQLGFGEQLRRQNAYAMEQDVVRSSAKLDRGVYQKIAERMANLAGTPFGDIEKRGAATMSDDMAELMSYVAQINPELADQVHGLRGSTAVMGQRIAKASRYMQDPSSGAIGLSKDSTMNLVSALSNKLYGENADLTQMRGISAGKAGEMFDQMTRRGMLGTGTAPDLKEVAKEQGKTLEELANLPDFSAKVQEFQANRTADRLKAMTGAVSAMRDIFGENGQANAPMSQIFNALQKITQNNLANMNPADIEKTVRNLNNASKMSGLDMQGMMGLTATAGQATDKVGLNRAFAMPVSTEAAVFAAAYADQFGNSRAFGAFDKERMLQIGANLSAAASASAEVNEAAALTRMRDTEQLPNLAAVPELEQYLKDLDSDKPVEPMPAQKLRELVSQAGGDVAKFVSMSAQRTANQPISFEKNYGSRVGMTAFRRTARSVVGSSLSAGLVQEPGMEMDQKQSDEFLKGVSDDLLKMDPEVKEAVDNKKFSSAAAQPIIDKIQERYQKATGKVLPRSKALSFIDFGMSNLDESAERLGYGTAGNLLAAGNERVADSATMRMEQVKQTSAMDIAVSNFGVGTPTQRFVEAVLKGKPNETLTDFIRSAFDAKSPDQIDAALKSTLGQDASELRAIENRDVLKDVNNLMTTAGAGKLQNLPKDQAEKIEEIKRIYQLTDADLQGMSGKTQQEIQKTLNKQGVITKTNTLKRLYKNVVDTGLSKLEAPEPTPDPNQKQDPQKGQQSFSLNNMLGDAMKALNTFLPNPMQIGQQSQQQTAPNPVGDALKAISAFLPAPPTQSAQKSQASGLTGVVTDAMKSLGSLIVPELGKTDADKETKTKTAMKALSGLVATSRVVGGPLEGVLKATGLEKIVTEDITKFGGSGKGLLAAFDSSEKKKQEEAEKKAAKVQTVRLEGGTELSGRLNIVSEEVLLKIPQTQKI
jgi:hypothetical protein